MQAKLILESGKVIPKTLLLTPSQPATLGRSRESSMVVQSDLVSRMHAKIYYEDGRWVLRDFGLNGTRVEGSRVTNTVELDDGSVIQLGDAQLRFELENRIVRGQPRRDSLRAGMVASRSAEHCRAQPDAGAGPHHRRIGRHQNSRRTTKPS